jgi:hypothetical protein
MLEQVKILRTNFCLDYITQAQGEEDLQRITYHTLAFILTTIPFI